MVEVSTEARARLGDAMREPDLDAALAAVQALLAGEPAFADAWAYLGNTLVTRKRRFADGLAALERATELDPANPWFAYTLGWCHEYAANALARPKGGRAWRAEQPPAGDADALYAAARASFLRALTLDPDDALRGDIEDMLDVVANATGVPWREE
jgi:tetratricopeptide (TPR) repeat protein